MEQPRPTLNWGSVDVAKPHFLILYSEDYEDSDWNIVAVMQANDNVYISLISDDIEQKVLDILEYEVDYYVKQKVESDNIAYLIYHCGTMANIYSHIHFSYVPKISTENIVYFIKVDSKLCDIVDKAFINQCYEYYYSAEIINLFDIQWLHRYDTTLRKLANTIFEKIGSTREFNIKDQPDFDAFKLWLKILPFDDYSIILNYLYHCKYVQNKDFFETPLNWLIRVFHTNKELS